MKKIIINTKYLSPDYRQTLSDDKIGLRGNKFDYVIILITVFYILGFLLIVSS